MNLVKRSINLTAALLTIASVVHAADEKPLVISGGDIYTISDGIIRNGTLLVEDGKISRIGTAVETPEDAEVIDASGKIVMPGLVATNMSGPAPGNSKKIADAVDPHHIAVSFALASGITATYVQIGRAGATGAGGTNAVIKMTEGDLGGMLLKEPVAVNASYPTSTPSTKDALRRSLKSARDYLREKAQYEKDKAAGKKVEEPKPPRNSESAIQLLQGELPARIGASSANDILAALELVDEFGIHLILDGVVEGWTVAEEMAERNVDAIISPRRIWGKDTDIIAPSGSSPQQAAILKRAGVRFAIIPTSAGFSTGGGFGDDLFTFPYEAAHAVGGGLDEETALEAITLRPAEMFGVADRIGSLEEGKDADIIILDGHPLHYGTLVDCTLVNGKVLYERSKSTYFSHIRAAHAEEQADEETEEAAEPEETAEDEP